MQPSNLTVGSICSGIEAASVAWADIGFTFEWFSEISDFPSKILAQRYPQIPNLGDMSHISEMLISGAINSPDVICAGTPCQSFSVAGWMSGLTDLRGNLTLEFVEIIKANDAVRKISGQPRSIVFWENVEGVLRDKTNAFGCLLSSLLGVQNEIKPRNGWPKAGMARGPERTVAWRVLDAKYFGLPQQRRRLYLVAGGPDLSPENILFERHEGIGLPNYPESELNFTLNGHSFEVFRSYTDCLYAAYGTKWNGNAAAYNGSLFVCQNDRLRRLTPLECERIMGFPDGYTKIEKAKPTARYQAIGNSWSVPVVRWLGNRVTQQLAKTHHDPAIDIPDDYRIFVDKNVEIFGLQDDPFWIDSDRYLNCSPVPSKATIGNLRDIVDPEADEKFYLTPVGCKGILRRRAERNLRINPLLEERLIRISSQWSDEKIEAISKIQPRGRFGRLA